MNNSPVNLIDRLPEFMQQYDEIQKITASQNPEFDRIWEAEALMRKNLYIATAEEEGLRRYEKLLNITPLSGDSFEDRRNHIMRRWNQITPYTFRFLIGMLEELTNGRFNIATNFKAYEMEIVVYTLDMGVISDLAYIIRNMIPCNIDVTSTNKISIELSGSIALAAALNTTKHYIITQDFNAVYDVVGAFNIASSIGKVSSYTIVQDFKAEIHAKAEIGMGAALTQTKDIAITNDFVAEINTNGKIATAGSVTKVTKYKI